MIPLELDNPFWQFSLRVYGTPGVAEECLKVQDEIGADVNVLLYAAWLGATRGIVVEEADLLLIEQAISSWSASVVKPLRGVRRTMKSMPDAADSQVQALRKQVAATELLSEQIEQAFLFRMADGVGRPGDSTARGNVSAALGRYGAAATAFPLRKFLAASDAESGLADIAGDRSNGKSNP